MGSSASKEIIQKSDYMKTQYLGKGGFGYVIQCEWKNRSKFENLPEKFARKKIRIPEHGRTEYRNEWESCSSLNHRNNVQVKSPSTLLLQFFPLTKLGEFAWYMKYSARQI